MKDQIKDQLIVEQTGIDPFLLRLWLLTIAVIALAAAYVHLTIGMSNDHLAQMYMAKKLLDGKKLYVDVFDVNPPLIYMLYTLPLMLSRIMGMPPYLGLNILTLGTVLASIWVCAKILRHSAASRYTIGTTVGTLLLALIVTSLISQVYADREHLMMTLAAPFLLLYSPFAKREAVPERLRTIIAYMAAVGFALKPYFYVFYLAVLLSQYWQLRSPKKLWEQKELKIIAQFAISYLLVILLFFYDYISTIIPIARLIYQTLSWGTGSKWGALVNMMLPRYALIAIVGLLLVWCASPRRMRGETAYLSLIALAGLVSYFLNSGWYYTQYPFIAAVLPLSIWMGIVALQSCNNIMSAELRGVCKLGIGGVMLTALAYCFVLPSYDRGKEDYISQRDTGKPVSSQTIKYEAREKLETHLQNRPRYMFLSVNFWAFNLEDPYMPRRQAVGRFSSLGALPSLNMFASRTDKVEEYDRLLDYTTRSLSEDIVRQKPDMVIVDASTEKRKLPADYSILGFLTQQANFNDAWQDYKFVEKIDTCQGREQLCAFEIYYRKKF